MPFPSSDSVRRKEIIQNRNGFKTRLAPRLYTLEKFDVKHIADIKQYSQFFFMNLRIILNKFALLIKIVSFQFQINTDTDKLRFRTNSRRQYFYTDKNPLTPTSIKHAQLCNIINLIGSN